MSRTDTHDPEKKEEKIGLLTVISTTSNVQPAALILMFLAEIASIKWA